MKKKVKIICWSEVFTIMAMIGFIIAVYRVGYISGQNRVLVEMQETLLNNLLK